MYLNRADRTFKALQVPRLLRSKDAGDTVFPLPLRLLAHYLPQHTLDVFDEVHSDLQRCGQGETRDVCVKTLHDGWVLGKKAETTQRECYAFFDTKVPSVADLSGATTCEPVVVGCVGSLEDSRSLALSPTHTYIVSAALQTHWNTCFRTSLGTCSSD